MAILDLFRPKWKHSNSYVRKEAIGELFDKSILLKVTQKDKDPDVVNHAQKKIQRLVQITNELVGMKEEYRGVFELIEKIIDPVDLKKIVFEGYNEKIRKHAIKRIEDKDMVRDLYENIKDANLKKFAFFQMLKLNAIRTKAPSGLPMNLISVDIEKESKRFSATEFIEFDGCACGGELDILERILSHNYVSTKCKKCGKKILYRCRVLQGGHYWYSV